MTPIITLPKDMIKEIAMWLEAADIASFAATSVLLVELFHEKAFWVLWSDSRASFMHKVSVIDQIKGYNPWLYYAGLTSTITFDTVFLRSKDRILKLLDIPGMKSAAIVRKDTARGYSLIPIYICKTRRIRSSGDTAVKYIDLPKTSRFVVLKGGGRRNRCSYALTDTGKLCIVTAKATKDQKTYISVAQFDYGEGEVLEVADIATSFQTIFVLDRSGRFYSINASITGDNIVSLIHEGPYLYLSTTTFFPVTPNRADHRSMNICGLLGVDGTITMVHFRRNGALIYERSLRSPERPVTRPMMQMSTSGEDVKVYITTGKRETNLYTATTPIIFRDTFKRDPKIREMTRVGMGGAIDQAKKGSLIGQNFIGAYTNGERAFLSSGSSWTMLGEETDKEPVRETGMEGCTILGGVENLRFGLREFWF